ncbi:MAG: flavin reductase [Candidatus Marinimicrobia bacterium]|nr:flavin reductase [Candidatus Neomarinimicrobiota bacterium]
MKRIFIPLKDLQVRAHHLWYHQSLLLSSGDFNTRDFNCMTVGWGSIGTMWSKPFVQVVVRPTRYTHQYMEKYPDFTVSAFGSDYQKDLNLLGSKSGRDGDKLAETSLTAIESTIVAAPGYAEAELIIECRKMYSSTFKPEEFLDPTIEEKYPNKDYHTVYYGSIEAISGTEKYLARDV